MFIVYAYHLETTKAGHWRKKIYIETDAVVNSGVIKGGPNIPGYAKNSAHFLNCSNFIKRWYSLTQNHIYSHMKSLVMLEVGI